MYINSACLKQTVSKSAAFLVGFHSIPKIFTEVLACVGPALAVVKVEGEVYKHLQCYSDGSGEGMGLHGVRERSRRRIK